MAIVHRVDDPSDKCEYKVIEHLRENLPDSFQFITMIESVAPEGRR